MKLGIMQPYFMPYLGYIGLVNYVDHFILFDTPQFIRHGWIERNQILKLDGEPMYIKVPLIKHSRNTSIKDVSINNRINWKDKILAQLSHYKKRAPHYSSVIKMLDSIFEYDYESIVDLNYKALSEVCSYLDIKTPISIWSEMDIEIESVNSPDEWALNICKALNADSYYNPPGGRSFFDIEKYDKAGVKLNFLEVNQRSYKQFSEGFVPYLSIIDTLMFCDKEEIRLILNDLNIKQE
ncbi:WbqC family protein [Hyunsoonleella sp. SJ7]|uniref:WbqC family protein n=1 Tax=Hyunsoonleella aquatilis TaxID=2762758 RepID=A0A923KJT0_9FLAO|nr:WbqC family protein [Hyunsoonleella aquatilis]MBC3757747.1 WbqC family protein [Hyunsoonleella aquatilis]